MREKAQNKIYSNINILNAIIIVNDHIDQWIRQQLISKHYLLLQHLNENTNVDMERFFQIIEETQIEVDELSAKWA